MLTVLWVVRKPATAMNEEKTLFFLFVKPFCLTCYSNNAFFKVADMTKKIKYRLHYN